MEYFPSAITPQWQEDQALANRQKVEYNHLSDFASGFGEENITNHVINWWFNNQDFPPDENYNPKEDPQLKGYEDFYHLFMFNQSAAETTSVLNKLIERSEQNITSPWHIVGRASGSILDLSSLLLFTKVGQAAKVFGTAMLTEEIIKQNIDPLRNDSYVPWVAAGGYGIPAVINKFTQAKPNLALKNKIDDLDTHWVERSAKNPKLEINKIKSQENTTELNTQTKQPMPSVGAAGIGTIKRQSTKQIMEGEGFVKSNLKWFGEDGPWTPVFRVIKQKTSLTAKNMMSDLLDTPLLKLKNTKQWGFDATGKSIETDMRMMRVKEVQAHNLIKEEYLKYVAREQGAQKVPTTTIGSMVHNRFNNEFMSMNEFSKQVTIARLNNMSHDIQEVSAAARISQEFVYGDLFKKVQDLKIREMPVQQELFFWQRVLKDLEAKQSGSYKYWSKQENKWITEPISKIKERLDKLTKRLEDIPKGGVDNYINIIYIKNAIEKNPELFKKIIRDDKARKGKIINEAQLNELVKDLSNHFPFTRFEKTNWKEISKLREETLARLYAMHTTGQKPGSKLYEEALAEINDKILKFKKGGKDDLTELFTKLLGKETANKTFQEALKDINKVLLQEKYVFPHPRYARANRARELNLDEVAQKQLIDGNFILSDVFALQKAYARQMIPDILLTQKYGDTMGIGMKYVDEATSMTYPGLMKVLEEYKSAIFKANSQKEKVRLTNEMYKTLDDLEASIELIRGTYGLPSDPHAWTSVGMRTAKHYNALTMLTGFMAAMPDLARVIMTSGIQRGFKTQFEVLGNYLGQRTIYKMGKEEAQAAGEALDMVTGARAMLFADVGDMFGLSSKLEGGMGKLSSFNFMYVNLMSRWTEFAKSLASVTIGSRILQDSVKWSKGTLGDKWKTALASAGIDEGIAKRIAIQAEKHGEKTKHNFMANTAKWDDDIARDAFQAALNKDINITIVTPGLGDTPKFMSTEWGSTLTQFKKFAMAATQRMLMRGMQEKDLDFLFGSMLLLGSGMMIDAIYHKVRFNRDYNKLSLTQKLLNAFDRSGLAGIYTDVNKAIETLSDNRIGISPMLGENKPYGSSGRWKAGTIGGPTAGQIYNIFDILYDVKGGKYNHHTAKNVRRLIPFQNVWYLDWLFDDIQKGLY